MQPKNKSERAKAFVNFLLLFVLSIAIILTMVFFSIQVPVKEADDLRGKIHNIEKERASGAEFLTRMSEIVSKLDSINNSQRPEFMDIEIKESLSNLKAKVDADSVYDKVLYGEVVKVLWTVQESKKKLREQISQNNNFNNLQKDNENLKSQLDILKDRYNNLVSSMNQRR